jgi:hypothetical protein
MRRRGAWLPPLGVLAIAAASGCRTAGSPGPAVIAPPPPVPAAVLQAPVASEVHAIPGDFDRFDAAASTFDVLVPNREAPNEIVVFDAVHFTAVGKRAIRRGAVAWTYGGKVQVVNEGRALARIDADTGRRDAIDPALVAPGGESEDRGSISDDGKLFALHDLAVIDLDEMRVAFTLDPPCAGGPEPAFWLAPNGRFVVGSCRGTSWASLVGAPKHVAWRYRVADSFCVSADERVLFEGPYQPFAREWIGDFVLRDVASGKSVSTLPVTLPDASRPYAIALSGDGRVAAILLDGVITFYRTNDGTKLGAHAGPHDAVGTRLAFRGASAELFVATRGEVQVLPAP